MVRRPELKRRAGVRRESGEKKGGGVTGRGKKKRAVAELLDEL